MSDTLVDLAAWRRLRYRLLSLEPNWDSYDAEPISPAVLDLVDGLLTTLAAVPTNKGGLQIEMHGGDYDIEIDVDRNGLIGELFVDKAGEEKQ